LHPPQIASVVFVQAVVVYLCKESQSVQSVQGILPLVEYVWPAIQAVPIPGATHLPSVRVYPGLQVPQTASVVSVHAVVVFLFNNPQSVQLSQGVLPVADQFPSTHGATHTPSVSV
jgi:hypothetical protein